MDYRPKTIDLDASDWKREPDARIENVDPFPEHRFWRGTVIYAVAFVTVATLLRPVVEFAVNLVWPW